MEPRYSASQIAQYFLRQADPDEGDTISNLKLQKLLYYAQGLYLGLYGVPLFRERVEAWIHGPAVSDVYHQYKEYGWNAIPCPTGFDPETIDPDTREFLDDVWDVYGQFSAGKLRQMIHRERPWTETPIEREISHDKLHQYFTHWVERDAHPEGATRVVREAYTMTIPWPQVLDVLQREPQIAQQLFTRAYTQAYLRDRHGQSISDPPRRVIVLGSSLVVLKALDSEQLRVQSV